MFSVVFSVVFSVIPVVCVGGSVVSLHAGSKRNKLIIKLIGEMMKLLSISTGV